MSQIIPLMGKSYVHTKTGIVYRVVLAYCRIEGTDTEAVAYKREDVHPSVVWIIPYDQFADGRFQPT